MVLTTKCACKHERTVHVHVLVYSKQRYMYLCIVNMKELYMYLYLCIVNRGTCTCV